MSRLVMKFGGTSVANIDRIKNVARHVKREVDAGHQVAVVVSAMSGKTNELVAWTKDAGADPAQSHAFINVHDQSEYDVVVASGEQVTSGLLAITLNAMGIPARSWQGWQIPIMTSDAHGSARIQDVDLQANRVTARAVAATSTLLPWLAPHVSGGRMVLLKGQRAQQELDAALPWLTRRGWQAEVRVVGDPPRTRVIDVHRDEVG